MEFNSAPRVRPSHQRLGMTAFTVAGAVSELALGEIRDGRSLTVSY